MSNLAKTKKTSFFPYIILCSIFFIIPNKKMTAQCLGDTRIDARYQLKNNDICEGEVIQMANVSEENGNTNAIYIWNWGDGQIDTILEFQDASHVYNFSDLDICNIRTGEKKVELRLDAKVDGCEEVEHFVLKPIYIKLKPRANFDAPETVCAPDLEVAFQDGSCSAYDNVSYAWNFGDAQSNQNTSNIANPNHTFSGPGSYTVSLVVEDSC